RSPGFGIQFAKPWLQFPQGLIGHATKSTQRVVLGHSLLRADVAEHVQLLLVLSTHTFFLSGCLVETREFLGTASSRVFPQPDRGWPSATANYREEFGSRKVYGAANHARWRVYWARFLNQERILPRMVEIRRGCGR